MKKKIFPGIIILLIITGIFYLVYKPSFSKSGGDFILNDTLSVQSFTIEGEEKILVERNDTNWVVNDEMEAHPASVSNFLYAFTAIEIIGMQNISSFPEGSARKIRIKSKKDDINLRFYHKGNAEFLLHEGDKKLYRVGIKARPEVKLEEVFSDKLLHWQSRKLTSIQPDEIKEISVFPSFPWKSSFVLSRQDSIISLRNSEGEGIADSLFRREKAILYFSYYNNLYFEDIIKADSVVERLKKDREFYRIEVKSLDNRQEILRIYSLYNEKGKDVFYAAVLKNDSEMVLKVNYSMLDLLFEDFESFTWN